MSMGKQSIKSSTRFMVSAVISLTRKSGGFCIFCFINHRFCVKIFFEERHNQSAESGRDLISARFFLHKNRPIRSKLSIFTFYFNRCITVESKLPKPQPFQHDKRCFTIIVSTAAMYL